MTGPLKAWRRRRHRKRPFPTDWIEHLDRHVPFYRRLPKDLMSRFKEMLKIFVGEKHFIGAGGIDDVTDEMKVVIGASAVRLILHLDLSYYDRLTEIVVYPGAFVHPKKGGVRLGEAHSWGTVVLSWDDVLEGLAKPCDGHDTAAHEFAHVLDRAAGRFDGTPRLRAKPDYATWASVMSRHFLGLRDREPQQRLVLRDYGAKNEAEFFAVATESFFERSRWMKTLAPDLYDLLKHFYGFDPAADDFCFGSD